MIQIITDPTDASDASTTDDPADPSGDVEETRAQTILALTGDARLEMQHTKQIVRVVMELMVMDRLDELFKVMTEESVNAIIDGKVLCQASGITLRIKRLRIGRFR